jgi:hypothetical protein
MYALGGQGNVESGVGYGNDVTKLGKSHVLAFSGSRHRIGMADLRNGIRPCSACTGG